MKILKILKSHCSDNYGIGHSILALVYSIIIDAIQINPIYTLYLNVLSHSFGILECQLFLFVPKLFPILKKRLAV